MPLLKIFLCVISFFIFHGKMMAQDSTASLMNQLEKEAGANKTQYTTTTFKYTRIINGSSVENLPANVLDVRISHRFGPLDKGLYQFFGLDYGFFNVRVGFDYGITNNFMVGVGHNAWQKTYDAFFKVKILRQSSGVHNMPFTVSFVPTIAFNSQKAIDIDPAARPGLTTKTDPLSYTFQLLIARKFSDGFSLQVMPTFIHADNISYNHYKNGIYKRDLFAIGIGGTQKISKKMSLNAEYYYQLPNLEATTANNVVAFGIDIGTGGHVFQLHFTNSIGLIEKSFIAETERHGNNSGLRFGFNISRVFQLGKKHKDKSADWKK